MSGVDTISFRAFVEMDLSQIFKDAHFFQKPEGLLVGTAALLLLALVLRGLERWSGPSVGSIARLVRRPLMLGLGTALYAGFVLNQLVNTIPALTRVDAERVTTCLVLLAIWRSLTVTGLRFLHSRFFERWIAHELEDPRDRSMMIALLDRLFNIGLALLIGAALMLVLGVSTTAVGALLGGAGIGIGFGTQQISQNFLSGLMLFFNRPFSEGDWINVSTYQGTVERIGWYHTRIRTFDRRPLFIPNALFATQPIENPGRMYNRRIKTEIGLRYEDLDRIEVVVKAVREMLHSHPGIDQKQLILVNFNQWDLSSVNMLVYCFTETTVWKEWLDIQQDVFLKIGDIVKQAGADFAFPSTTIYPSSSSDPARPWTAMLPSPSGTIGA